jgi:hypothetical protein
VRALIVIGVLVVLAVTSVIWAIVKDDQTAPARRACGAPATGKAVTTVPAAKTVALRVLNATENAGLAETMMNKFKRSGFVNVKIGNEPRGVDASAEVRYGPAGIGAAQRVLAYVPDADRVQDNRKDASVDLVLGDQATTLTITPTDEVQGVLNRLGPPKLEDETAAC